MQVARVVPTVSARPEYSATRTSDRMGCDGGASRSAGLLSLGISPVSLCRDLSLLALSVVVEKPVTALQGAWVVTMGVGTDLRSQSPYASRASLKNS